MLDVAGSEAGHEERVGAHGLRTWIFFPRQITFSASFAAHPYCMHAPDARCILASTKEQLQQLTPHVGLFLLGSTAALHLAGGGSRAAVITAVDEPQVLFGSDVSTSSISILRNTGLRTEFFYGRVQSSSAVQPTSIDVCIDTCVNSR